MLALVTILALTVGTLSLPVVIPPLVRWTERFF